MKLITLQMINEFKIKKLGFDMMGYTFNKTNELSYHHLVIPRRFNGPMIRENGAILKQATSHDYLHRIEQIDHDMFLAITSEMIDENIKGRLDIDNLKKIRDTLLCFEREYSGARTKKGHPLIKEQYIRDRIRLD